ncbi:hypothetical protein AB5I41_22900 [Sphingomonas sp. MMS24-JH45]
MQQPATNNADRTTRYFHDAEGRAIGTLDGLGWLSTISYDPAGQKVAETRYASAVASEDRASGTFDALVASLQSTSRAADRPLRLRRAGVAPLLDRPPAAGGGSAYAPESRTAGSGDSQPARWGGSSPPMPVRSRRSSDTLWHRFAMRSRRPD